MSRALAAYERLRRPRVKRIVAEGARSSGTNSAGPVGRALQGLLLPLVFRFLVTEKSKAWIYGHHLDWQIPISRELSQAHRAV